MHKTNIFDTSRGDIPSNSCLNTNTDGIFIVLFHSAQNSFNQGSRDYQLKLKKMLLLNFACVLL